MAIHHVEDLVRQADSCKAEVKPGEWVPAKPLDDTSWIQRIKAAWMVLTCKADAVYWTFRIKR